MENKKTFKFQELADFADMLKANGFDVIIDNWSHTDAPLTYFHFHKEGKIGYVQAAMFRGFSFSTVHKPSREVGTGFHIGDDMPPTVESAEKTFLNHPHWAKRKDVPFIKKYKSLEEFMTTQGRASRSFIY